MCRQDGRGRFPVLLDDLSKCRTNSQRKSQNCSLFPLAFLARWLQGHWWGFISRNYVVWPTFFLMNVFIALKGSHFWFYISYMVCTLNGIYKQYNKLHEHWYTKISSLRCVADRNPPKNASDLYTKYWSYAEHCRPCTRLSGVNWWKQKQITLIVPIGYSLFVDHRSVPSSGPGFVCYLFLPKQSLCTLISR